MLESAGMRDRRTAVASLCLVCTALIALVAAIAQTLDVQPNTPEDLITAIFIGLLAVGLIASFVAALVLESEVQPTNTIIELQTPTNSHRVQINEGIDCVLAGTFVLGGCVIFWLPMANWLLGPYLPNTTCALAIGYWVACFCTALVVKSTGPACLELYPDGLLLRLPWRERWVPFVALEAVQANALQCDLQQFESDLVRIRWPALDQARRTFVTHYIEQNRHNSTPPSAELLSFLTTIARTGVVPGNAPDVVNSYRELATDIPTAILSALENPKMPEEIRIGAALLLRSTKDPRLAQRLRRSATSLPPGPLRTVLLSGK